MRYVAVLVTMPVLLPFPEVNKMYEILYCAAGHGILNGLGKKKKERKPNLHGRNEERINQIKVAVDRLRMNGVVLLLLTGLPNHLDRLDAVILLISPIDDPDLVQMFHVKDVYRVSIGHDDLYSSKKKTDKGAE